MIRQKLFKDVSIGDKFHIRRDDSSSTYIKTKPFSLRGIDYNAVYEYGNEKFLEYRVFSQGHPVYHNEKD